jgi:hypothetical protein
MTQQEGPINMLTQSESYILNKSKVRRKRCGRRRER